VIANPEVQLHERCPLDAFVILACDGVWDVMSNEQVAAFVTMRFHHHLFRSKLERGIILPTVGDELVRHCFDLGSTDNLSVVIASLFPIEDRIADPVANLSERTAKALCFDPQS
jgi:serine/threonine protein phosphatase PrpC